MRIITLTKLVDKALDSMDLENHTIVNNVQGGYITVENALQSISPEWVQAVKDAGELWTLIEALNEVENDAYLEWNDDEIEEEDLICILS